MSEVQTTAAQQEEQTVINAAYMNKHNAQAGHVWIDYTQFFRKTVKDGQEIPAKAPISIPVIVPTAETIAAYLADPTSKVAQLVTSAVEDAVIAQVKDVMKSMLDEDKMIDTDTFPYAEILIEHIAALPPKERARSAIPDEAWTAFGESYTSYMVSVKGLEVSRVKTAVELLVKRCVKIKHNKQMLGKIKVYLADWFTNASGAKEDTTMQAIYSTLSDKIEEFLAIDDAAAADHRDLQDAAGLPDAECAL